MFDSIGWGEILVLGLAALFIFGPERLPTLAKDAAQGLKRVREAVTGVRGQLHDSLGDDFDQLRDLDLRRYNPKTFIRDQLIGEGDPPPVTRGARPPVRRSGGTRSATAAVAGAAALATGAASSSARSGPRDRSQPAPYDTDAT